MLKRFKKKQPLYLQLDLHGIKHEDVFVLVEDFLLTNQDYLQIKIIYLGNLLHHLYF